MFPFCVSILHVCFFLHVFYCLSISLTCKLALSTDQPTLTTWGLVSVSGMVTGSFSRTLTSKQTCGKNMLAVNAAGKIGIHLRVILEYRATYLHTSERFLEQDIQNKSGSVFYSFAHTSHVRSFSPTQPPPPPPTSPLQKCIWGGGGNRSMIKSCNKISVLPCQI